MSDDVSGSNRVLSRPRRPSLQAMMDMLAQSHGTIPETAHALAESLQLISDERLAELNRYLADTKTALYEWLAEFLPLDVFIRLGLINRVKLTRDIRELARMMTEPGEGLVAQRVRFESYLLMSIALFSARWQAGNSMDAHIDRMRSLLFQLEPLLFADEREVTISMRHETTDPFRVTHLAVDTPLSGDPEHVYSETILCRVLHGNKPCIYDVDDKKPFKAFLKMLDRTLRGRDDALHLNDLVRTRFVVPHAPDVQTTADVLRAALEQFPDTQYVETEQGTNGVMNAANPHSAQGYRAKKLVVTHQGVSIEIQILDMRVFFNTLYAVNEAHHTVYAFRGALPLLKIFRPTSIYHVDFDDPVLIERQMHALRTRIKAQMEARIRR